MSFNILKPFYITTTTLKTTTIKTTTTGIDAVAYNRFLLLFRLGAFAYFPLSSTNLEHYPKRFDSSLLYNPVKQQVARLGFPVRLNPLEDSGSVAAWGYFGKNKATSLPTHPSPDVHLHPEFLPSIQALYSTHVQSH